MIRICIFICQSISKTACRHGANGLVRHACKCLAAQLGIQSPSDHSEHSPVSIFTLKWQSPFCLECIKAADVVSQRQTGRQEGVLVVRRAHLYLAFIRLKNKKKDLAKSRKKICCHLFKMKAKFLQNGSQRAYFSASFEGWLTKGLIGNWTYSHC